ncbi:MAG: AI-2E family transporter [Myxococcota bacterium]|nr:AI-2E family transporter [Myxococcota bacterium]
MAARTTVRLTNVPSSDTTTPRHVLALRVGLGILFLATCVVLWPFWPWLTLAAWFSALARPMVERLARITHGKRPAAAIATLLLLVISIGPIIGIVVALSADAAELVHQVMSTRSGRQAVIAIVSPDGEMRGPRFDLSTVLHLFRSQGERAWTFASSVAGATADLVLGLFVFFTAAFFALVDGPRAFEWVERHTPIAHRHALRFSSAFVETGRGLFVGVGLTGLVQAVIATIAYSALDVPRAIVLGVLTFVASFIPTIGTALIWVPVAAGLALTGRESEAVILAAIGVLVVGTVDNLLRPVLARWGRLHMHMFVVLVSMLGGLAVMGGWGLMMGPLVVRLTLEALRISKEEEIV